MNIPGGRMSNALSLEYCGWGLRDLEMRVPLVGVAVRLFAFIGDVGVVVVVVL